MAEYNVLDGEQRTKPGTAEARRLRRDGRVPGVVYGHGEGSVSFSTSADALRTALFSGSKIVDLQLDGGSQTALLKEVQWDTFGEHLMHVDLQRVSKGEKVEVEVRIELHGIAPGATAGGVLDHHLHTLPLICPALQIPEKFEVNVNHLEIGDVVHVSDLSIPDYVEVQVPPETVVVQVTEAIELPEEDEDAALAPVEPELLGRKDEDAEDED
jgi:large subunit ribosomal protein L25